MKFHASEVAAAVGGELFGRDAAVDGVAIDSRDLRPGQLFVPIVGARNGHDFISAALRAGAAAYLTAEAIEAGTAVRVADTSAALLALGRWARGRLPDRVVGITGSVGKTSTKDLLASVLATTFATAANERSFNNELGVPLTLAGAPDDSEAVVVEMGARGVGHIALLCDVARPTVGVVTVVADAHLELFRSLDDVARAKGELVESLPADGTAVLNADDPRVAAMASRSAARVLTYGLGAADVRAEHLTLGDDLRPTMQLRTPWGSSGVQLAVHGAHQVGNALAAAAAGLALGVPLDAVAEGLAGANVSPMRMHLATTPSGARVIDDTYNANPTSMAAALEALARLPATRRTAVLGLMAELGPGSAASHRSIAAEAARLGVRVVSVAAPEYGIVGADAADDLETALDRVGPLDSGDAVLVKGSRVVGLERLVAYLLDPGWRDI
ncbi:MAG: UDP-N-acetylmuramoylalanyl-D-glutamyl-2,6-diaminopimelate--D-alanyl-D-alanine ligase [Acidimicrobiales bacterium]|nr:UDP-N-acetylmuramoylalanyl-D-glutamyl-2,6-diaminopimelate--D-alanyl-D-alanine ligase [Acidimicrobiales bacterium]